MKFITTDLPVILIVYPKMERKVENIDMMIMPSSPDSMTLAFNKRSYSFTNKELTDPEVQQFNLAMTRHADRYVFSSFPFNQEAMSLGIKILDDEEKNAFYSILIPQFISLKFDLTRLKR